MNVSYRRIGVPAVAAMAASIGLCVGNEAMGQSLNIDFGPERGSPPSQFAGAGSAGYWNVLDASEGSSFGLLGLDGEAAGVSLELSGINFSVDPTATVPPGPLLPLLGDYAVGPMNTGALNFSGLVSGEYELIVYLVSRQDFPREASTTVDGITREVSGVFGAGLVEGETHTRHVLSITDGALQVELFGGGDVVTNGVQLTLIPSPAAPALLGLGMTLLAAGRRRR